MTWPVPRCLTSISFPGTPWVAVAAGNSFFHRGYIAEGIETLVDVYSDQYSSLYTLTPHIPIPSLSLSSTLPLDLDNRTFNMAGGAFVPSDPAAAKAHGNPLKNGFITRPYLWPFCLTTSLFFLWGFAYGLLDVLNKHFRKSSSESLAREQVPDPDSANRDYSSYHQAAVDRSTGRLLRCWLLRVLPCCCESSRSQPRALQKIDLIVFFRRPSS